MIVRNGSLALAAKVSSNSSSTYAGKLTDINGNTSTRNETINFNTLRNLCHETVSGGNNGIVMNLGSGSAQPTPDDYWLAEPIDSSNYSCALPNPNSTVAVDDDGNLLYTFAFNVAEDVTVSEISLSYLGSSAKYMLARKVIPPRTGGGLQTFTFVIKSGE